MSEPTDMLERYIRGLPLNEELAALARGDERPEHPPEPTAASLLDDDDREHLRRLIQEPGWAVTMRLLDAEIERLEDVAKAVSMNDPLGDRDIVANQWAYVAMLRRSKNLMIALVEREIQNLHEQTLGKQRDSGARY